MADINITKPRNILFVFDEQDNFAFKGVAVENWRRVILDGEVLKDEQLPAVDVLPEEMPAILESINVGAVAQVAALTAALAERDRRIEELETQV